MDQDAVNTLITVVVGILVPVIGLIIMRIESVRKEAKADLKDFMSGAEEVRLRLYDVQETQGKQLTKVETVVDGLNDGVKEILSMLRSRA